VVNSMKGDKGDLIFFISQEKWLHQVERSIRAFTTSEINMYFIRVVRRRCAMAFANVGQPSTTPANKAEG
jgi:hypothetical protein